MDDATGLREEPNNGEIPRTEYLLIALRLFLLSAAVACGLYYIGHWLHESTLTKIMLLFVFAIIGFAALLVIDQITLKHHHALPGKSIRQGNSTK